MITNALIQSLNPCKDRLDNYLKFYSEKSHTKGQFMGLKNISQGDKLWAAFRLMTKENIVLVAADIAESVLYIWEREYPKDLRPRKAIEAARSGIDCASASSSSAAASNYAAYASDAANAAINPDTPVDGIASAAAACAHAASCAATTSISSAAAYAACAYAAACAADYDARAHASLTHIVSLEDKSTQEKLTRKIILKYWR